MKVIEIFTHNTRFNGDNCDACISKLCCTVFDILHEFNQGREAVLIKPSGEKCNNLGKNGECCIYDNRKNYKGYPQNCLEYTCYDIGPLINGWIQKNNININQQSRNIALLMRQCILFVTTGYRYEERYRFIKEVLLEGFIDPGILYEHISNHWYQVDQDFSNWSLGLPENQEFMKELGIGL